MQSCECSAARTQSCRSDGNPEKPAPNKGNNIVDESSGLQHDGKRGRYVAIMLSVFGDESADETQQRVFAVAGVIGSEGAWAELEAKWVTRNGGIPFHAADCESGHGDGGAFSARAWHRER